MAEQGRAVSAAGVAVTPAAIEAAEELALALRAATAELPFGADPTAFLAILEELAPGDEAEP